MNSAYVKVQARVRYWEDATINGIQDNDGKLTPFRQGNYWCPLIRLSDGFVMNWPVGTIADIHFKVCDDGEYWLLDEQHNQIAKWGGFYVPDDFLCHGDTGFGDYIILNINADGFIEKWKQPQIEFNCECDEESQRRWIKIAMTTGVQS